MKIISKHRTEYWIVLFLTSISWILFITYLIYKSLEYGKLGFNNKGLWISSILVIITLVYVKKILYYGLKKVIISEKGIKLKYLLDNKIEFLEYKNILNFEMSRESNHKFAGKKDGGQKLEIVLKGDKFITLNADEYKNYHDLKKNIYSNFKKQRAEKK